MTTDPARPDDPLRELRELMTQGRFQDLLEAYRGGDDASAMSRPEAQLLAATAATRVGDLPLAGTLARSSLARFRQRGDSDGRMRATNLLGVIAFERGELEQAAHSLGEALEIARELEDGLMAARASNNLASVAQLRGKPELALSLYRSALLNYQRLGDRRGTAETYHNLGLVFRQMEEWHDADEASAQAVRHAEMVTERSLVALAIMGRAEIHLDRGELDLAAQELERGAQLAEEAGDEIGRAEVERLRAVLALARGDYAGAAARAAGARERARQLGSALLEAECSAIAARALRAEGRLGEAEALRTEALAGFRALGATRWAREFEKLWEEGKEKRT